MTSNYPTVIARKIKMARETLEMKSRVGTMWENDNGNKIMVLAYDLASDQAMVYNYIDRTTGFLDQRAWDDHRLNRWEDVVAGEKDLFERVKPRLDLKLWEAFVDGRIIEDGKPQAIHQVDIGGSGKAYPYQEAFVSEVHGRIGLSLLETFARNNGLLFKGHLDLAEVNHLIWRTHPTVEMAHDEVTGRRYIKCYARLAALKGDEQVMLDREVIQRRAA